MTGGDVDGEWTDKVGERMKNGSERIEKGRCR
jgi:hypothetical protein